MKKRLATVILASIALVTTAGAADVGMNATTNRCHDKNGRYVEGPGCNPSQCQCLFHEIYEYVRGLF